MKPEDYTCSDCGDDFDGRPYYTVDEQKEEYLCPTCAGPYLEPDEPDDPRRTEAEGRGGYIDLNKCSLNDYVGWLIDVSATGNALDADTHAVAIVNIVARILDGGGTFDQLQPALERWFERRLLSNFAHALGGS